MALSGINFNSEDFEWSRAPLASMEDLSQVNTPIPTPTAGQSPKTKSRWSHRYSQMSLDNMLGPINEMGEEETETDERKTTPDTNKSQNIDQKESNFLVKSTDPVTNDNTNLYSDNPKYSRVQDQNQEAIKPIIDGRPINSILKNGDTIGIETARPCLSSTNSDSHIQNSHTDVNRNNTGLQLKLEHGTVPDSHYVIDEIIKVSDSKVSSDISADLDIKDDINEDPLGHIQWPKSAYQSETNYSASMSPYPSLIASAQAQVRPHDPQINYRRMNVSSPRWRTCDVIPEEENMQIYTASQYEDKYLNHHTGYAKETDNLLLRPRQVQFISPKHKRKTLKQYQMVGASESNPIYSPGVVRSQRAFVQPKQVSSEMASLIRANDGSIDGAKCHIEPKDR